MQRLREFLRPRRRGTMGSVAGALAALALITGIAAGAVAVDGIFGPRTQATVRRAQCDLGLRVDGIVGPRTWRA